MLHTSRNSEQRTQNSKLSIWELRLHPLLLEDNIRLKLPARLAARLVKVTAHCLGSMRKIREDVGGTWQKAQLAERRPSLC